MIAKMIFVAVFVSVIIFLYHIYPNIKRPKWERKLISAKYLRARKYFVQADEMLEQSIAEFPSIRQLYTDYYNNYSTLENMEKLFKTVSTGYEKSKNPAAGAATAWCYIEEGEYDKAEVLVNNEEIADFCYENNMPLKARLFYKKGDDEQAEKEFENFYKSLFPDAKNDFELYSELRPDELISLVILRKKISKSWKVTAKIIPVESLHEEYSWRSYYNSLLEKKESFKVISGIYGDRERVYNNRKRELDDIIETLGSYLSDK